MSEPSTAGRVRADTGRAQWRARVAATPEAPFLLEDERAWTFAEADAAMRRVAGGLEALGIGPGTRVLVGLPNGAQALFVHAALRELGAVIVPLVGGLTAPELAFQVGHSGGEALIATPDVVALHRAGAGADSRVRLVVGTAAGEPAVDAGLDAVATHAPVADRATLPGYDERSPWAIFYTSGSTGRPKGVLLPAGAFVSAGAGYADRFAIAQDDNYVLPTPMAHAVGGLTAQCIALYTGCRLTLLDRFRPTRFWEQVRRAGATVTILFPAHLNLLLETEASGPPAGATSLRLTITHQWLTAFRERFGVELGLCWGMTETGATSAGSLPGYAGERGDGYIGPGMDGVEVGVFGEHGERLGPDAPGEIGLRHRHAMLAYLGDPETTAQTLVDGWVRSGDRGYVDADGHLVFLGRIKNMIKRSGENISPQEIELALDRHPAVVESLVLGVPDPLRTEEVAAVVVARPGTAVTAAAVVAFADQQLARWKAPRYVLVRPDPLPRLANGKVDRATVLADLDLAGGWDRQRELGRA